MSAISELRRAIRTAEVRKMPHTPELLTNYWRAIWAVDGKRVNMKFNVPPCDRTAQEIRELEGSEIPRKLIYVPPELTTPEGLVLLTRIYPEMRVTPEKVLTIKQETGGGWLDIEDKLRAPYTDMNEYQAAEALVKQGLSGQRFSTYIVGWKDAKRLRGLYFDDEGIWEEGTGFWRGQTFTLMLGSRIDDKVIHARSSSSGFMIIQTHDLGPRDHYPCLGYRSERAKTIILPKPQALAA